LLHRKKVFIVSNPVLYYTVTVIKRLGESMDLLGIVEIVGVAAFAASGAIVALEKRLDVFGILVLSTVTAVGGGVIRDVVIKKETLVLSNELYVTPVIFGAASLMAAQAVGVNPTVAFVIAMLVTTGLRVLSIQYDWRLPRVLFIALDDPSSSQRPSDPLHAPAKRTAAPAPSPLPRPSLSATQQNRIQIKETSKCCSARPRITSLL
jgi:hypothetical protein